MKRTLAISALALTALTGAASAMVSDAAEARIKHFAPNANVQALTEAEVNAALSIINGGGTESEKRGALKSFVR
ncbi:MAG: hypothetical protein QNJ09_02760 [Paracoccaceae bacterium]|nr:hypothetical protein [Paracoccaceae bacterium]